MRSMPGCDPVNSQTREPLLAVNELVVDFATWGGTVHAVRGVSFTVHRGETFAIVGESGCGKSVSVQSLMGLIPMPPGRIVGGTARWRGHDLLAGTVIDGREVRGREIGMIFQDPMSSLNPTMTIGAQIAETLEVHRGLSRRAARARAIELLELTRIPDAERRASQYPFEFSGGMLQRAMIAAAIACEPALLIADEPTTALDVTIQAQILALLAQLKRERGMSMVLVTHDLGVVAGIADRVVVMYGGRIVERGAVKDILLTPQHPYTRALLASMPRIDEVGNAPLQAIAGQPPNPRSLPSGCAFHPRCALAADRCANERPALNVAADRAVACHFPIRGDAHD